jgi:hypothetical protein
MLNAVVRGKYKMRNIVLVLCMAALAGCAFQPATPDITQKFDEFVGMETAKVGPFDISRGISWDVNRGTQRTGEKAGQSVFLITVFRNGAVDTEGTSSWKFISNNAMHVIVNGKSHNVGSGRHDGLVKRAIAGGVFVLEEIMYTLGADDLRAFTGDIKTFRGRIGLAEFELNEEQILALVKFVETEVTPYVDL